MKCLSRNRTKFFYALYSGKTPIQDEYGNTTGEYEVTFGNPKEWMANISAAQGEVQAQLFGANESYDKVIIIDNASPPIDEYSILWVDTVPQLKEDGSLAVNEAGEVITPHDYVVKKVAKSLNSVSLAVCKVNVS